MCALPVSKRAIQAKLCELNERMESFFFANCNSAYSACPLVIRSDISAVAGLRPF